MYNNNNNSGGGGEGRRDGGSLSGTGMGRGVDYGGARGIRGQRHPPDEMHMYGNATSQLSSMGRGGGQGGGGGSPFSQAMMGMNVNNMSTMGGMNNMSGMTSMSGMGSIGMSAGIPDMNMLAVYRANENMVMMNERRAAVLQGRGGGGDDQLPPQYQGQLGNMSSGDGSLLSYLEGSGTPLGLMGNNFDIGIAAAMEHRTMDDEAISASMKTRKRRKKSKKDSDMPRRALSAYNIFFSEQREKILEEIDLKRKKGKMKAESNDDTDKEDKEDGNDTVVEESKPKKDGRDNTDEDESNSAKKKSSIETKDEEEDSGSKQEAKEENEEKEEKKKKKNKSKECNEEDEGDDKEVDSGPTVMTRSFFPAKTKRAHRKVHGKIGLVELAREVSKRWKVLDPESRSHYDSLAEEDRKQHKQVLAEYHQRKAAENMVNMGRKDNEDYDSKTDEKEDEVASKKDIRETITHHHQQRIVAEMMIARQAHTRDPILTMGNFSPSMGISSPFRGGNMNPIQGGGTSNMQDIRDIQDMQAVLRLQNQRALMIQRMRMSGGGGGMGTDMSGRGGGMDMGDSGDKGGMGGGSSSGIGRGMG